ncbi:CBS domain-containing protein [Siccirubricoccus deserti]
MAVARLLAERGISAVPVLDKAGTVLGLVTEADLIRRLAGAEDQPTGWFRNPFADPAEQANRYARTHGATAADIMTTEVVTVEETAPATHIAHLMEERGIRRVLVVQDGKLRGWCPAPTCCAPWSRRRWRRPSCPTTASAARCWRRCARNPGPILSTPWSR